MLPVVFTDFRREMIARTLFDLLKIWVAAAFASKFFVDSPAVVKFFMSVSLMTLGGGAIFCCPLQKPKE